jgi:hypothetical protein
LGRVEFYFERGDMFLDITQEFIKAINKYTIDEGLT